MNEMIDRVAEAIAITGNGGTWDDWYNEDQKEFHRKRARAAIDAMRTPTKAMIKAGAGKINGFNSDFDLSDDIALDVWEDMIEKALK